MRVYRGRTGPNGYKTVYRGGGGGGDIIEMTIFGEFMDARYTDVKTVLSLRFFHHHPPFRNLPLAASDSKYLSRVFWPTPPQARFRSPDFELDGGELKNVFQHAS